MCPGLNTSLSILDCPPGYFEILGAIAGFFGGGIAGGGAGTLVAAPTGELAAPVMIPAGAIAGAIKGAAAGYAAGAALDGIVQMANAGRGRARNRVPNKLVRRIAKDNNLNEVGRRALHDEITGQDLTEEQIRQIAEDLANQEKYLNNPPPKP